MKIGFVGCGKLGYPVACAIASRHHEVFAYDVRQVGHYQHGVIEQGENGEPFDQWFEANPQINENLHFTSLIDVTDNCDIIFIAVPTPHQPQFEGITPLIDDRADFDYTYLEDAIQELSHHISKPTLVVVISTVLPGTIRSVVLPLCSRFMRLVYNPFFVAMGTVIQDFLRPEFVLMGSDDKNSLRELRGYYKKILDKDAPVPPMSIESSELTKCAYNLFIGQKIIFANTLMEICTKIPQADVDEVSDALSLAHDRITSSAYLRGGMSDSGPCHPRDTVAMSWLARNLGLSYDLFSGVMECREAHTKYLADMLMELSKEHDLPIAIYGIAYKPKINLMTGSSVLLVKEFIRQPCHMYDPYIPTGSSVDQPHVILIGTKHGRWATTEFPQGSVILDPFRYIPDNDGITVIRLGERQE